MDNCIFCNKFNDIIYENSDWIAIYDKYPVSEGHVLIISKQHHKDYFDLSVEETLSLNGFINIIKKKLDNEFHPDGYNIGCNCGEAAGQTIEHFHLHIIPRYNGDVEDPKGGVRGVIPEKKNYQKDNTPWYKRLSWNTDGIEKINGNIYEWIDGKTLECHCYNCDLFKENYECCLKYCKRPKETFHGYYKRKEITNE